MYSREFLVENLLMNVTIYLTILIYLQSSQELMFSQNV